MKCLSSSLAVRAVPRVALALALAVPVLSRADAGVLIPSNKPAPDPSILSLEEMEIKVLIDNGVARVEVRQIFANHEGSILEGEYLFALPARATVSDFAVWDGVTRIPGVILERKRAGEIYENLKWQSIDPGLLQVGERGADEARRTAVFSARIVPIPAHGTKRMELEYHETIPVENLESYFAIPLRPDAYRAQVAGRLRIDFELRSAHALRDFQLVGTTYPLEVKERTPHLVRGRFEGRKVTFQEDFAVRYALDSAKTDRLEVLTYREPVPGTPPPTVTAPEPAGNEPGFFEASAVLGTGSTGAADASGRPRTVLALFDTSLSMQWEKLDRSYQALEALLRGLRPADRFNLLVFNTEVTPWAAGFVAAEPAQVEAALAFVKSGYIRGGTDMERVVKAALGEISGQRAGSAARPAGTPTCATDCYLVLFTDGGATRGSILNARLAAGYEMKWKELPEAQRPRTFVFAVGDDANLPLLRLLARHNGVLEWARSTEPIEFKLQAFLSKIGRSPVAGLQLSAAPESNFDLIYPLDEAPYAGSVAAWIGQYRRPMAKADFGVRGTRDGVPFEMRTTAALPERNVEHPHLPRLWARRRVDALLEKIEREGEDRDTVDEIIRLARRYKFVTPYTSFLAAPRALLRPRVIRPGDPVLRVKTDPSIVSVIAMFPFGLVKPLRYLPREDTWQTRFLAPKDLADGTYQVRLVLRDRRGQVYRESKSFVIASQPPVVRVRLAKSQVRRGESVALRVSASASTRTIVARLYGAAPVQLRWNENAGANTGELIVPRELPAGRYTLRVIAEDMAHNIGSQEVPLEVLP
ncbi:MAG TPA: VIT domain-containing protein [Terriglobales bacterium]|nr:VIT domain-containing protein [Terriglobales bacterium]